MTYSGEMILGNAAGKLVLEADGLIQYNNFLNYDIHSRQPSAEWALERLTDLEYLRGRPKAYSMTSSFFYPLGTMALERPAPFPELLLPHTARTFRLPMIAEPANRKLRLCIHLTLEQLPSSVPHMAVSVNGHWPQAECVKTDRLLFPCGDYGTLLDGNTGYIFTFPVSMLQDGWNDFTVFNLSSQSTEYGENEKNSIRLLNMDIGIVKEKEAMMKGADSHVVFTE
jgi:hypothetical protein